MLQHTNLVNILESKQASFFFHTPSLEASQGLGSHLVPQGSVGHMAFSLVAFMALEQWKK